MTALASLTRHLLTSLAGLGGFLFAHGVISAAAVTAANEAGAALVDPLAVLTGLAAAGLARLAIFCLGQIFPGLAGKLGGLAPGGVPGLIAMAGTAAALMGALPACSTAQAAGLRAVPLKACVRYERGAVCYSSKSGLAAEVDLTPAK